MPRHKTAFDAAVAGIGSSMDAIGQSMDAMRATLDAIREANHAQGVAIDAVIAATQKGLALVTGNPQ